MYRYCRPVLALVSACASVAALAEEHLLAPVQIIARPLNAAADVAPEDSTGPVRVIDRDAFEHRITTLADTLRDQTGVQIRQSGGLGSFAAMSVRGSSGKQVQVFLDGMLLNDPLYGSVDISLFSLHDVTRIQVYPGNPPARIAQAGPGGVILMESLGAETQPRTRLNLGAGSFGTQRQGVFNSGAQGRFHYWVSANRQAADNDFRYRNRSDWFNPTDGAYTTRRNADIEQYDASLSLGYDIDPERQLSALFQWADKDQGIPTIQNWRNNRARLEIRTRRGQIHFRDQRHFDGRLHSSHRLTFANIDESYQDMAGRVGTGRYDVRTATAHTGFNNTFSWVQDGHVLSASLELSHYDQEQVDHLSLDPEAQRERLLIASALSHEWQSGDARWRTQAVLRRTDLTDKATEAMPDGSMEDTRYRTHYDGWQLGLRHRLFTPLELYANLSRQVRVPSLLERFGQQGQFVGNRNLLAEEAVNAELGARLSFPRGYLEITGFHRDLDPAIVTVFDARGVGRHVNVAAEFRGLELEAHYALTSRWVLTGNATVQHSENVSREIFTYIGKQVPGVYHRSAMLRSTWYWQPFQFDLSWHSDDDLYYDAANNIPAESRRTLDASVSWAHSWLSGSDTRLDLSVRNVSDEHYQDFNRFPSAGRTWTLTLQHTL